MSEQIKCPKCGSFEIFQEEVDVGVGIMKGPPICLNCGYNGEKLVPELDLKSEDEREPPF